MSTDLLGFDLPSLPFKDIRDQRGSVAEIKATLCLQLTEAVRRVPLSICAGDIKATREWREHCVKARKVLASTRSSVTELTTALAQMRSYS